MYIYFIAIMVLIYKGNNGLGVEDITGAAIFSFVAVKNFFPFRFPVSIYFPVIANNRRHIQNNQYIIFRKFTLSPENNHGFGPMIQVDPFKSEFIKLVFK